MTRKRADIAKHGRFLRLPVGSLTDAEVAQIQREHAEMMAACIRRGKPFSAVDAAAMLRVRAEQPWRGRRPAGADPARTQEREALRQAAAAIEAGEPFDVPLVAAALRAWAKTLRDDPRRPRGKPACVDPANIALEFEAQRRRRSGLPVEVIMDGLVNRYRVSRGAIMDARTACGDAARRHFDAILSPAKTDK